MTRKRVHNADTSTIQVVTALGNRSSRAGHTPGSLNSDRLAAVGRPRSTCVGSSLTGLHTRSPTSTSGIWCNSSPQKLQLRCSSLMAGMTLFVWRNSRTLTLSASWCGCDATGGSSLMPPRVRALREAALAFTEPSFSVRIRRPGQHHTWSMWKPRSSMGWSMCVPGPGFMSRPVRTSGQDHASSSRHTAEQCSCWRSRNSPGRHASRKRSGSGGVGRASPIWPCCGARIRGDSTWSTHSDSANRP